jgi:hypothetical protein
MTNVLRRVNRETSTTGRGVSGKVGVKSAAMQPLSQPAESAKQFLISKVVRQADSEGVLLSDLEKRMLNFSEGAVSAADIEAVANFDSEYDSDAYEAKIARLLRRAYQHDAKLGQTHQWQDALGDVGRTGILVMGHQTQPPAFLQHAPQGCEHPLACVWGVAFHQGGADGSGLRVA